MDFLERRAGMAAKSKLDKQADEILKSAEHLGVEHNYMFVTSFRRYLELIAHLEQLEKAINKEGTIVTKEYVKGRENIYVNPAVTAYNQTAGAADKTAALLLKYISAKEDPAKGADEFEAF